MPPRLLAAGVLLALAAGGVFAAAGAPAVAEAVWAAGTALALIPLTLSVARTLRAGRAGVDVIALLAMGGALALGEYLAGAVVALMLAGGNALEDAASRRARRDLTALLERAPRIAHRRVDGALVEVAVDALRPGDVVMVRPGEIVPVDGRVLEGSATLDEAALTGESLPVSRARGDAVRSGSVCAGAAFALHAERAAADSAYSTIVRLVKDAQASRAPFVRMADRYAAVFLPATLALAVIAWVAAGDPVRALAVLVVATPCPLILAAPVAIVCGMSRAARAGVIVKDGAAIEGLGGARSLVIDKTGTLTLGEPVVERVVTTGPSGARELLRLAASADQVSAHGLAEALVHTAERRGLHLSLPEHVVERPGQGIEGDVDGHRVTVGSAAWLAERDVDCVDPPAITPGRARVYVGVDGEPAGTIVLADAIRPDARAAVAAIRQGGVREIVMATGDRAEIAEAVGAEAGVDRVRAGLEPEAKLAVVRELRERLAPVVMVGDGINDAPALALADVGVAMGAAGSTVSAETADAVIVVDRLDRLAEAMRLSRRALRIAKQSVLAGMGLSIAAMGVAAAGYLPPLAGALLQEVIDVAVIANALRVLRG